MLKREKVDGFPRVDAVFVEETSFGYDHMDVRIKFDVFTESMKARADSRSETAFLKPRKNSLSRGFKKEVKKMQMLLKNKPEIVWGGKGDMIILDVWKKRQGFRHPSIGLQDAAGVAEAGFAGERNDFKVMGMFWAGILGVTKSIRVTAAEHFVNGVNDIIRKRMSMLVEDRRPMILKDLA